MTDYYPLIARAVSGLAKNTGENRRALYERARTALLGQLQSLDPPLGEHEITRERLLLEEAIRRAEAEAARQQRPEPSAKDRIPSAKPAHDHAANDPVPADAMAQVQPTAPEPQSATASKREDPTPSSSSAHWAGQFRSKDRERSQSAAAQALKGFRDLVAEVHGEAIPTAPPEQQVADLSPAQPPPRPAKPSRPSFAERSAAEAQRPRRPPRDEAVRDDVTELEHRFPPQPPRRSMREILAAADAPDSRMGLAAVPRRSVHPGQFAEPEFEPEVEPERARGGRRQAVVVAIAALLMIAAGLTLYWQRDRVRNLFAGSPATQVQREAAPSAASRPKISDRVGQAGQPNTSGNQDAGAGAAVAQRVVLYEDDPGDPQGKPYVGTVLWQTETKPSSAEQSAETSIRGELEIPDRRVKMTMLVRRNFDKALPASHTIEIMFNLPADFPFGGISNVPGILMKPAEQTRGSPLAGLAVKVTSGYFLIGLSGAEEDMKRNLELLKDRAWFDIPIVYSNGRRAILAVEKGTPGDRAFQQAFAAWGE